MIEERKTPTKRALAAMKTKERLYDSAITLISRYGFDTVTIEDITNHAKVSKGTFYTYYSSKEEVLVEMFSRIDHNYESVFASLPENTTASDKLILFMQTMFRYVSGVCGNDIMRVVYMSQLSSNCRKFLCDRNRPLYRLVEEIIKEGRQNYEFVIDMDDDMLLEQLVGFSRGIIYDWCLFGGTYDLLERGTQFFRTVTGWISGQPCRQIEAISV